MYDLSSQTVVEWATIYHDILLEYIECQFKHYKFIAKNNIMKNITKFFKKAVPQKLQPGVGGSYKPFSVFGT